VGFFVLALLLAATLNAALFAILGVSLWWTALTAPLLVGIAVTFGEWSLRRWPRP
jgi:hypothetical protein